ncbi:dephospho-CoA kinase-domain containing protein [Nitzschia inconspicua]|uniref:Dephospho-CoA kinase-domain containing protein n=1 Tax=Nitzschia inconspicua TaxID=303405 RepID=A0A9K3PXT5_9STRA|nr:dephospho-CoA kinase-domain containing protein [Nitzschia inconspicua]
MLTRPFTRLVVAFGVRKITQRRLVEELVLGILFLVPFGFVVGLFTSRLCTKFTWQRKWIRSDVWTTMVVFFVGDILMEWLLPSLSCLPMMMGDSPSSNSSSSTSSSSSSSFQDDDPYHSSSTHSYHALREDEFVYDMTWLFQSFGLWCPSNFASSETLLSPDATAILFSLRLVFLCIGVHLGESLCFVALTGGIATGKTTVANMFVEFNPTTIGTNNNNNNKSNNNRTTTTTSSSNNNNNSNNQSQPQQQTSHKRKAKKAIINNNNTTNSNETTTTTNTTTTTATTTTTSDDDGYKEGTVQLICADAIAHQVLLSPDVLARRARGGSKQQQQQQQQQGQPPQKRRRITNNDDDDDTYYDDETTGDDDDDDNNDDDDDEDDLNHFGHGNDSLLLVQPSDSVYPQIVDAFHGKDILTKNGRQIDRLKLGSIVFASNDDRRKLNRITHPRILSILIRSLLRGVFFGSCDIVMADVPLLFESGKLSWLFGVTICVVVSDPSVQLERLQKRNPELTQRQCQERINSQLPMTEKANLADIVIDNSGSIEDLYGQVEEVRKDLMGRLYGIGMSLLQMLLLIGGSTSIAVSSKFYTNWQQ